MRSAPIVSLLLFAAAIAFFAMGLFQKYAGRPDGSSHEAEAEAAEPSAPPHERRRQAVMEMRRTGNGQVSYDVSFDPRNPYADRDRAAEATVRSAFDPQDDYWGLPRTDGHRLVAGLCAACHSLEIVMQQRMTPERWAYTLNWMIETQGMAHPGDEELDAILAYVTAHFSSEAPAP